MIDARKITFSKLVLPKTESTCSSIQDIAIGYFDNVSVENIVRKQKYNYFIDDLLMSYYDSLHEKKFENIEQSLFVFTNTDEIEYFNENGYAFSKQKIDNFWKDDETVFNRFFSLLHIKVSDLKQIYGIIGWLNKIFNSDNTNEYNATFYFSFDYSDIVICVKNMNITEFTNKIFSINYSQKDKFKGKNYSQYIKDTFSVLVLNNKIVKKSFDLINQNSEKDFDDIEKVIAEKVFKNDSKILQEKIRISCNIGVQDSGYFNEFIKEIKKKHIKFKMSNMIGRHDITIVQNNINLIGLITILYYVDKYSTNTQGIGMDRLLFNCETFIRVKNSKMLPSNTYVSNDISNYIRVKNILEKEVLALAREIEEYDKGNNIHIKPIKSLCKSIVDTMKNGFADDFIVCIYEPFVAFIEYMRGKIRENGYSPNDEFDRVYTNFFEIVNSLVNSAMHSERQFIQTPSFSPVFFDVPPKLMAFYTAMTNQIAKINNNGENDKYSFIFKPSFASNIYVYYYSYLDVPPTDRLLAVSINEKSLYNPINVMIVMGHEVAHFIGGSRRAREKRKEYFLKTIIFLSLKLVFLTYDECFYSEDNLEQIIATLTHEIFEVIKKDELYKVDSGYSENFNFLLFFALMRISHTHEIDSILVNCLRNCFPNCNIGRLKETIKDMIYFMAKDTPVDNDIEPTGNIVVSQQYFDYIKEIVSVFQETYADIQMILLMDISFEKYISNLMTYENVTLSWILASQRLYYRIIGVTYTLVNLGIWNFSNENINNERAEIIKIVDFLRNEIIVQKNSVVSPSYDKKITKVKQKVQDTNITIMQENTNLYEMNETCCTNHKIEPYVVHQVSSYLCDVIYNTCCEYGPEKKKLLLDFRKVLENVSSFKDSAEVFYEIQKTNESYLKNIIESSQTHFNETK